MLSSKEEEYNQFWKKKNHPYTHSRSRQRALIALEWVKDLVPSRILDCGCGTGEGSQVFLDHGFEVWGVDISSQAVEKAREKGIQAFQGDLETLHLTQTFSLIVCMEVLEHLQNPAKALERMAAHLDSRGKIILSLPNDFHLLRKLHILPPNPYHCHHFTPKKSKAFLKSQGFKVLKSQALPLIPPRYPRVARLFQSIVDSFPSLFSISVLYLIQQANGELLQQGASAV